MNSGELIKSVRIENNLTQSQVAEALGVTRSAYCGYEIGRRKISLEVIQTLSDFYNLPISVFFDGVDNDGLSEVADFDKKATRISYLSKEEQNLIFKYRLLDDKDKLKVEKLINAQGKQGDK